MKSEFLIGAATSNSGKTTLTMGLLRALHDRGLSVQSYKCGPDYIDPMFHDLAAQRESVNLDLFMSSAYHVKTLFNHYGEISDVRLVEGVMGLFDGPNRWSGSSGELAMLLDIPVVLVVSAKSVAYSVAPIIHGFQSFIPPKTELIPEPHPLKLAGVVFNQVASDNHFQMLKRACEDAGAECLGYIRRNPELVVPSRHLGLTIPQKENMEHLISLAAKEVEANIDIDKLLELTSR